MFAGILGATSSESMKQVYGRRRSIRVDECLPSSDERPSERRAELPFIQQGSVRWFGPFAERPLNSMPNRTMKIAAYWLAIALLGYTNMAKSRELGIIGRSYEDDLPVIYKLVDEMPEKSVRVVSPWLTVIAWKYDGGENNGMPGESVFQSMVRLETAIEDALLRPGFCQHAYSRTGNGLKELVYYISDREAFLSEFNEVVSGHPRYPIEINFYNDPEWEDFG